MQICLVRHGRAEAGSPGMVDNNRALTPEGVRQLEATLARAQFRPSLILSSPLLRARQTAQIAARVLGYQGEVVETKTLLADASPEGVWEEIRCHSDAEHLLLVTHEPLVSAAAAYLVGAPNVAIDFLPGTLLCVDVDAFPPRPHGMLKWMLAP